MKSLAKNSVFNIIYTVLNMLFPLVISIYVSRVLLAEGVGKVAYAQNIASYFINFAALGLPTYGVREIAKTKDGITQNKLFTELFIINAISTTICSIIYILMIFGIQTLNQNKLLFFACALQLFFNYINIDWFYKGREEYVYIVCRSIIVKVLSIICIFAFVKNRDDYVVYGFISSFAICGNYIFNIIHAKKYVKFDFKNSQIKRHLSSVIVLAFSIFLSSIYSKIDITMLGVMAGDRATGIYSNAHKIINIIIAITTAISAVYLPRLSFYYKEDEKKFLELIDNGVRILCFLVFPIAAGLYLLSPYFVELLYGSAFSDAALTIRFFVPILFIRGFGDLLCYQLVICTGNEKKRLPAYLISAIINICLNYILIPVLLQNGAAIASVISEAIVNVGLFICMRKTVQIKLPGKSFFQGASTAIVMAIVVKLITLLPLNNLLKCGMGVCCGFVVYIVLNFITKNKIIILFSNKIKERMNLQNEK